jgi:predicted TIM-barrel fold metal-dependent hydrolase
MECIFGIHWTVAQIRPWILDTVELFGPDRCMFASHLPICNVPAAFNSFTPLILR